MDHIYHAYLNKLEFTGTRNSFGLFKIVVHIKASFGDVKIIHLDTLLLRRIFSTSQNLFLVKM